MQFFNEDVSKKNLKGKSACKLPLPRKHCITITRDASHIAESFSEKCSHSFESYFLFLIFSLKFADQMVENESTLFSKS